MISMKIPHLHQVRIGEHIRINNPKARLLRHPILVSKERASRAKENRFFNHMHWHTRVGLHQPFSYGISVRVDVDQHFRDSRPSADLQPDLQ